MRKILIVEDNELNLDMLTRRLKRAGFSSLSAENGKVGVEVTMEQIPSLILMDMNMPIMDGFEATQLIKANEATKDIPIIALTAYAQDEDESRVLEAGCNEYMSKPIDFTLLLTRLEHYGLKPSK